MTYDRILYPLQKPQLKVGKTKPKASNFTDTSFKAKSIVVSKQSISVAAPTAAAQFAHNVSLLKNRSDAQRVESLSYLTSSIASIPTQEPLPEAVAVLLPKLLPLVLDGSNAVRQQLAKLLATLASRQDEIRPFANRSLLYIHAGMSHLSSDIRTFAVEVLDWLIGCAGSETVACAGGWRKTLDCFLGIFGWNNKTASSQTISKGWSSVQRSTSRPGAEARNMSKVLATFAKFLSKGMSSSPIASSAMREDPDFPLRHARQHLIPTSGNAFGHLNLFGPPRDEESEMLEEREDRQRAFRQKYYPSVDEGLEVLIKEGGEIGRAAGGAKKALIDGLRDYEADDDFSD